MKLADADCSHFTMLPLEPRSLDILQGLVSTDINHFYKMSYEGHLNPTQDSLKSSSLLTPTETILKSLAFYFLSGCLFGFFMMNYSSSRRHHSTGDSCDSLSD